jgi:hypothetical protein
MTSNDFASLSQAAAALASLVVACAAFVVSLAALRTQREALPVSARFGFGQKIVRGDDGVRWIWAWMENTGTRVYVHDVSPHEWKPEDLADEFTPNLASARMPETIPPWLSGKKKRELKSALGVYSPQFVRTKAYSMFWVSCPPGVEAVQFTAAVGVGRRDPTRFISSEWITVPK